MKKLTLSILSLILLLCAAIGFVGCGKKHTHSFTAQKAEQQYLASAATCTEAAKYYYSCACGEKGTQTFTSGNTLGHKFTNYVSDNNATCTQDGTKTATCDRDGCHEKDTVTDEGSKLPHTFDKQVATEEYLASAATCENAAKYYYSCACGEKGTQTFTSGNPNGHTYSEEWSQSETEHWHEAICGHDVEKERAKHNFDGNKKCTVCDYVTTKPLGLELQSSAFNIDNASKTAYLKVANAVEDYDFSDKFVVADGARFDVCTDKQCNNKIASKKTDLVIGDNVFYILVTNGNDVASYTVTLRRRPIYTVTFNANGGSEVEAQFIEEENYATEPATERKGYDFIEWDYDFSSPILENTTITASWNIITYNITYELNGGENAESNPTTYTVEDEIALSLPTKTGYTGSWSSDGKIEKGSVGDITFTASYTINQYNISVKPSINGICTFTDKSGTYDYNTFVTLEISDVYLGYEFLGWYNGESLLSTDNVYTFNVPANDITITAKLSVKEEMQNYYFTSTTDTCKITDVKHTLITSAVIPDYVTSIGDRAFYGCNNLDSITLPFVGASKTASNGYNQVFGYIFGYTTTSKYSDFVSGATCQFYKSPYYYHYYIPSSLKSVKITGGDIPNSAFSGCKGLTSITIPDSVTSIGSYALYKCSGLKSVTIPNGVISIDEGTFYRCTGLTSITIPDSVTSIGNSAFEGCSGLTSITIPDGVTSIGDYAFSDCSGIESITVSSDNAKYHSNGNCLIETKSKTLILGCKNSIIPTDGSVTSIGSYAFYNCSGLTSVTISDSVTSIDNSAFYSCSGLTSITIPDSVTSIGYYAFSGCSGLTSITIPDGVTSIANSVFKGCSGLTSLVIPDGVTSIGDYAFSDCSGLTSITIPDSVTSIGDRAFSGCYKLVEVINKSSLNITKGSYNNGYVAYSALNVKKGGNSDIVNQNDYLFYTYGEINYLLGYVGVDTDLVLPDNYNGSKYEIYEYAFRDCSGLTSIVIPDGVTSIGWSTFKGCSGLTSITIPDSVTSIGGSAFSGCSGLTSITIPDSVTSIGGSAFSGCSGLTSITIPNSVTSIGYSAFRGCSGLTSITLPFIGESSKKVNDTYQDPFGYIFGTSSYSGGVATKQYYYGSSTSNATNDTYYIPSSLKSVTITGGNILYGAFYNCSGLTSVTIGDSVTSIGDYAFRGCSELTEIHYKGTKAQWNAISKGGNWNYNTGKYTIYCTDGNIKK